MSLNLKPDLSLTEHYIFMVRDQQVMLDRDLASLYGVETKVLNQAVKRNIARFPEPFRFQLTQLENDQLVTDCDRFASLKHSTSLPYAFTEQGVAMLSAVLRSDTAVQTSIGIMNAFVRQRQFKFNAQYPAIKTREFKLAHDRFLIIDDDIYHIGASLKDLGKKWFAFSKMEMRVIEMLGRVEL